MSTYQARALADRVVLVHDMPDQVAVSELEVDQAELLLQQLEAALRLCRAARDANAASLRRNLDAISISYR